MITDPKTAPETRRGRRIYALAIGLLGALLIAPMQTEFGAKVALLGSLTIVCAARPLVILAREALERRRRAARARPPARPRWAPVAALGPASFAGAPRRGRQPGALGRGLSGSALSVRRAGHDRAHARRRLDHPAAGKEIAADAIADLRSVSAALEQARRDAGCRRGERPLPLGARGPDREGRRQADRRAELPREAVNLDCCRPSTRRRRRWSRR